MSLSSGLRDGTAALHRAAESAGAMRLLLDGRLGRQRYGSMLRSLHAIYASLEQALQQHQQHPLLAPILLPGLARAGPLEADLQALCGPAWLRELAIAPAAQRYARRLRLLARLCPHRLAAHAYVRYLGDLHGGQALRVIVARSLQLRDGSGVAFYEFGAEDEVRDLIARFRRGLDEIEQRDPVSAAALVHEAQAAFRLHIRLFEELASPSPETDAGDNTA